MEKRLQSANGLTPRSELTSSACPCTVQQQELEHREPDRRCWLNPEAQSEVCGESEPKRFLHRLEVQNNPLKGSQMFGDLIFYFYICPEICFSEVIFTGRGVRSNYGLVNRTFNCFLRDGENLQNNRVELPEREQVHRKLLEDLLVDGGQKFCTK